MELAELDEDELLNDENGSEVKDKRKSIKNEQKFNRYNEKL